MSALAPAFYTQGGKDPTALTWPPTMLIELALKTAPPDDIRKEYGYSTEDWEALPRNPVFMKELTEACELVRQEGMSYKLKARMLAEEFLPDVYKMVKADGEKGTPASVRADMIKFMTRVAGYDVKASAEGGAATQANTLNIQINLGDAE